MDLFKGIGFFALNLNEEEYPRLPPPEAATPTVLYNQRIQDVEAAKPATQKNAVQ
jgi:hypothetical protein